MKFLCKYLQVEFLHRQLVEENRRRRQVSEWKLLDTGIFADIRYYHVVVEYAKATPENILIAIRVTNRDPATATASSRASA